MILNNSDTSAGLPPCGAFTVWVLRHFTKLQLRWLCPPTALFCRAMFVPPPGVHEPHALSDRGRVALRDSRHMAAKLFVCTTKTRVRP